MLNPTRPSFCFIAVNNGFWVTKSGSWIKPLSLPVRVHAWAVGLRWNEILVPTVPRGNATTMAYPWQRAC
jgi:hypothetical protein